MFKRPERKSTHLMAPAMICQKTHESSQSKIMQTQTAI